MLEMPLDSLERGLRRAPVGEGRVRVGDLRGDPRPKNLRLSTHMEHGIAQHSTPQTDRTGGQVRTRKR